MSGTTFTFPHSTVNQWIKRKLFSRSTNVGIVFNHGKCPCATGITSYSQGAFDDSVIFSEESMWLTDLILQTRTFSPEWLSLRTPLSQLQVFIFLCGIRLGFNFHLSMKKMVRLSGGEMSFSSSLSYTQLEVKSSTCLLQSSPPPPQQSLASYPSSSAPIIPVLPYFPTFAPPCVPVV